MQSLGCGTDPNKNKVRKKEDNFLLNSQVSVSFVETERAKVEVSLEEMIKFLSHSVGPDPEKKWTVMGRN